MKSEIIFQEFRKELAEHNGSGFHLVFPSKINSDNIEANKEYLSFLKTIGKGSFFAGALQIFDLNDDDSKRIGFELGATFCEQFLVIGYDGTTEGCFVLNKCIEDLGVYYVNRKQPEDISKISDSFKTWIEGTPNEYYDEKLYKAFGNIKDIIGVYSVINERKAINVKLYYYDKELVAHPNAEKKYLKRYNKLVLSLNVARKVSIKEVTIKMARLGSDVGEDNIEYVTVQIAGVVGNVLKEVYLFDPFNLPFEKIVCLYQPEVNLNSKMRIKYKELLEYL
jgi:hypothetical protein